LVVWFWTTQVYFDNPCPIDVVLPDCPWCAIQVSSFGNWRLNLAAEKCWYILGLHSFLHSSVTLIVSGSTQAKNSALAKKWRYHTFQLEGFVPITIDPQSTLQLSKHKEFLSCPIHCWCCSYRRVEFQCNNWHQLLWSQLSFLTFYVNVLGMTVTDIKAGFYVA